MQKKWEREHIKNENKSYRWKALDKAYISKPFAFLNCARSSDFLLDVFPSHVNVCEFHSVSRKVEDVWKNVRSRRIVQEVRLFFKGLAEEGN